MLVVPLERSAGEWAFVLPVEEQLLVLGDTLLATELSLRSYFFKFHVVVDFLLHLQEVVEKGQCVRFDIVKLLSIASVTQLVDYLLEVLSDLWFHVQLDLAAAELCMVRLLDLEQTVRQNVLVEASGDLVLVEEYVVVRVRLADHILFPNVEVLRVDQVQRLATLDS